MAEAPSWKHFKLIFIHPTESKYIDVHILKANENVVHFDIIESNDEHIGIDIYKHKKSLESGTIRYDSAKNCFECVFKTYEKPDLPYDTKDLMKSIIKSDLFSGKYNSKSSMRTEFPILVD